MPFPAQEDRSEERQAGRPGKEGSPCQGAATQPSARLTSPPLHTERLCCWEYWEHTSRDENGALGGWAGGRKDLSEEKPQEDKRLKPKGPSYQDSAARADLGAKLTAAPDAYSPGARSASRLLRQRTCPYLAVLAHSSDEERVFQGDVEASTGDANVWKAAEAGCHRRAPSHLGPKPGSRKVIKRGMLEHGARKKAGSGQEAPRGTGRQCGSDLSPLISQQHCHWVPRKAFTRIRTRLQEGGPGPELLWRCPWVPHLILAGPDDPKLDTPSLGQGDSHGRHSLPPGGRKLKAKFNQVQEGPTFSDPRE